MASLLKSHSSPEIKQKFLEKIQGQTPQLHKILLNLEVCNKPPLYNVKITKHKPAVDILPLMETPVVDINQQVDLP